MNTKPARGTRDFLPNEVRKRDYVIGVVRDVYERYGFEPLETPSFENLETLTSKYGDEGDQLMYKILKRGDKLRKELSNCDNIDENQLADLALRFDLTVPLARVVANYKNELPKFFKRYQIQPVWRADRPAKGRYREFYQCDVDAIGSKSIVIEAELIAAVSEILTKLGFDDYVVRVNNRDFLKRLIADSNIPNELESDAIIALDKLDKIGLEGLMNELKRSGVDDNSVLLFTELLKTATMPPELAKLSELIGGMSEIKELEFDPSLARGLSYYTGAIFEIILKDGDFGASIAGGGRYDGLIGMFGKEEIPAAGISLGLERILFVMEARGLFPGFLKNNPADVLVTIMNDDTLEDSLQLAAEFRKNGISTILYPEVDKLKKQFKYANQIDAKWICILGETEIAEKTVTIKDLESGEQESVSIEDAIERLRG